MKKLMTLCMFLVLLLTAAAAEENWLESIKNGRLPAAEEKPNVAVLHVAGELLEGGYGYDHQGTLNAVLKAEKDAGNQALLLLLDTPGGGLYEADELYHTLMLYKTHTNRPIYAYMGGECCSAGVLVAMAADGIAASRMSVTGNIGVYLESYSEAGLLDKLGIEHEYITTGGNKVAGYPTLTDEQRAIQQALVDESFAFFKQAITESRGLTEAQMQDFLDGRLLTAFQAKELGLIDEVLYYDEIISWVEKLFPQAEFVDVTPETEKEWGFDGFGLPFFDWLMGRCGEDAEMPFTAGQTGLSRHALKGI